MKERRQTRAFLTVDTLVKLVLGIVLGLGLLLITAKIMSLYDGSDGDVTICQTNAALRIQNARIQLSQIETSFQLTCPISVYNTSYDDVDRVSTNDKSNMEKLGYEEGEIIEYNLDKMIYKQLEECYAKTWYGEGQLFGREHGLFSSEFDTQYCVVCSVNFFDDELKEKIETDSQSAKEFVLGEDMSITTLTGEVKKGTLYEIITDQDDEDIYSWVDYDYTIGEPFAILYKRINLNVGSVIEDVYFNLLDDTYFGLFDVTENKDIQIIQIVPYTDPEEIATTYCDVIVNEFEYE